MNFPPKLSTRMDLMERFIVKGGVIIHDPDTTWISPILSQIGKGTVIYPNTYLVANDTDSFIGRDCQIGPNAFLREWFIVENNVKIGFGAEVVRSKIGEGTKIPHFCHVGDAIIGRGCNIAAGVIFCNFDGATKNTTIVEDDVFIGSGTMLIPSAKRGLRLGKCCFIAALSRINRDVPPGVLVIMKNEEQYIKKGRRVVKENGKWKIISHAEYYADFMNGQPPPDGV
ncbi:MAG: Bifunctional protein GlmU [Candidatus Azambacteria bacterium GW2011_GWA2_42_9]|uniref:Bifunctional protein GlmU n=1 Tax=Candidatus Azambacteria bacterium GW2011_GWA2_42_9 TaxID=1618613 RepID=A0A0G1BPA4_9BACT|nr:MAG: Bifunctional protein GlmU [Candidatus Azambacteria bacterium GW2011_GWA2_42_9]KKS87950.1 MAG: Bifunctional protein GlmU [Parcubacteria group bacterium GW2011_GWC1_43_11]